MPPYRTPGFIVASYTCSKSAERKDAAKGIIELCARAKVNKFVFHIGYSSLVETSCGTAVIRAMIHFARICIRFKTI